MPFEPDFFSLLVDKGTLDCVGMSRAKEPEFPWDASDDPVVTWAESMFRGLVVGGFLVVVSCCFVESEVVEVTEHVDVLGSDEYALVLRYGLLVT